MAQFHCISQQQKLNIKTSVLHARVLLFDVERSRQYCFEFLRATVQPKQCGKEACALAHRNQHHDDDYDVDVPCIRCHR